MRYSLIIPVYNRPDEVDELLASMVAQTFTNFEVIIVEDGSTLPCDDVVKKYANQLNIRYLTKPNTGPGGSRNYGAAYSSGEYVLVIDSDCILPKGYLQAIENELNTKPCDAFGGPDAALSTFSPMQKAVSYAMTSFFTTGGIRGGMQSTKKFYPRSFNMGIKRSVYQALNGFSDMRYGEDIDFSIRIYRAGYAVRLFPAAYVYHKRRTDMRKFFLQVWHSGNARIDLYRKYPSSLKIIHLLPSAFTLGSIILLAGSIISCYALLPLALFCILTFADSSIKNRSMRVGCLSVVASFVQLFGYGSGLIWRVGKK